MKDTDTAPTPPAPGKQKPKAPLPDCPGEPPPPPRKPNKHARFWKVFSFYAALAASVATVFTAVLQILGDDPEGPQETKHKSSVDVVPGNLPKVERFGTLDQATLQRHMRTILTRIDHYNGSVSMENEAFHERFQIPDGRIQDISDGVLLRKLANAWARQPDGRMPDPDSNNMYWWIYEERVDGVRHVLLLAQPAEDKYGTGNWFYAHGRPLKLLNMPAQRWLTPLSDDQIGRVIDALNKEEGRREALLRLLPKRPDDEPEPPPPIDYGKWLATFQEKLLAWHQTHREDPNPETCETLWRESRPANVGDEDKAITFSFSGEKDSATVELWVKDAKSGKWRQSLRCRLQEGRSPTEVKSPLYQDSPNHDFPSLRKEPPPVEETPEEIRAAVLAYAQEPDFANEWPSSDEIRDHLETKGFAEAAKATWAIVEKAGAFYLLHFPKEEIDPETDKADWVMPLAGHSRAYPADEAVKKEIQITVDPENWLPSTRISKTPTSEEEEPPVVDPPPAEGPTPGGKDDPPKPKEKEQSPVVDPPPAGGPTPGGKCGTPGTGTGVPDNTGTKPEPPTPPDLRKIRAAVLAYAQEPDFTDEWPSLDEIRDHLETNGFDEAAKATWAIVEGTDGAFYLLRFPKEEIDPETDKVDWVMPLTGRFRAYPADEAEKEHLPTKVDPEYWHLGARTPRAQQ